MLRSPIVTRSASHASLPNTQAGNKRSRKSIDESIPYDSMSQSEPGAPYVIGLRIHNAKKNQTKWLGEGDALVIGRNPTSFALPAGLGDLQPEQFRIDDPAMFATHAILWVSGGRPYVLCLRQGQEPTGDRFKLSAKRNGERSLFSIGERRHDELHRNIEYIMASKDKRFAITVCPHRQGALVLPLTATAPSAGGLESRHAPPRFAARGNQARDRAHRRVQQDDASLPRGTPSPPS